MTPTLTGVTDERGFRLLSDDELLEALREHPGTSATVLARLFHTPGHAVAWYALKAQLLRLADEGRLLPVTNGNRRKWTGWQVSE